MEKPGETRDRGGGGTEKRDGREVTHTLEQGGQVGGLSEVGKTGKPGKWSDLKGGRRGDVGSLIGRDTYRTHSYYRRR